MYTDFYQLKKKPFQISSDPAFIWLGEKHKEALATLRYSVIDNKGLMLLTGDVGTGKTTLINTLLKSLSNDVYYASVPDPRLELLDFLNYIAQAFHIDNNFESKGTFLIHFGWFLERIYKQKKKALLIVDEAQLLTQDLLEEIRLLSNINRDGNHLLNIFFVGQNEFNEILHRPENRAVTQRITLNYQINQLSMEETAHYISHRLRVAGSSRSIFSTSALRTIHIHSEGIPRRINVICDHCLLTGYTEGKSTIDERIVEDCIKEIAIPHYVKSPQSPGKKDLPQPQRSDRRPLRFTWKGALLLLLSVLLLSTCIAMLFSPSVDVSARLASTYQGVVNYLPGILNPAEKAQKAEGTADSADADLQSPVRQTKTEPASSPPVQEKAAAAEVPVVTEKSAPPDITSEYSENINDDEQNQPLPVSSIKNQPPALPPAPLKESPISIEENQAPEHPRTIGENSAPGIQEDRVVIRFERNSNDLSASNLDQLIGLGLSVKKSPDVSLKISGFTDSAGNSQYNKQLSLIRANMVKSYLLGLGIDSDRMTTEGRGSESPIADNTTEEGRRLNRRVEVEIVGPDS